MKIKHFLVIVFFICLLISMAITFRFIKGQSIENRNLPIKNFYIVGTSCSKYFRGSSFITINYMQSNYKVSIPENVCLEILEKKDLKFYYIEEENKIFYESMYMPFVFVYLSYIATILLPLIGFITYRKELDNNYSTM